MICFGDTAKYRLLNQGDSIVANSARSSIQTTETFQFYLKRTPTLAYHMEQPHVLVSGKTAVATFYWSVQIGRGRPGRTGMQKAHKIHGRGTHVFAKQGKEWKVVHEHFSRAH